jgi:hypothetical protein
MRHTVGIGEAADYLGIARTDLLALYRQDLVPWTRTDQLPRFEIAALDAFRPKLARALREAQAIERRGTDRSRRLASS